MTRREIRAWLEQRFFLRIHMTLILGGTMLAGIVMTWLLMRGGVDHLALRYAIAVTAAYLVFLALIRVWLSYVGSHERSVELELDGDVLELGLPDAAGDVSSSGLGLDFDADEGIVIVLLVLVVASLLVLAIYFIYTAPVLLTEAAFEAVLAAAVARRAKKATGPGWVGAVWRLTVWPFVLVLLLSVALGWIAQDICPEAVRLRDVFTCGEM